MLWMKTEKKTFAVKKSQLPPGRQNLLEPSHHLDNLNLKHLVGGRCQVVHLVGDAKTGHMDRPCHHLGMIPLKLTRGYGYVLCCLFCVFAKAFCDLNDSKGSKNRN